MRAEQEQRYEAPVNKDDPAPGDVKQTQRHAPRFALPEDVRLTKLPWSTVTGQLGDVMKESAQAALTLVKARSSDLQIAPGRSTRPTSRFTSKS